MNSLGKVTVNNLLALRQFKLFIKQLFKDTGAVIDSGSLDQFLCSSPSIEKLNLYGIFSYFNLDNFVDLNTLSLKGKIKVNEFNFDLFKNLCSQLKKLTIRFDNIDDEKLYKMFDGLKFQNLSYLKLDFTLITKLEKKLFDGFSNLKSLKIDVSEKLKIIDHDAFSDLKQLRELHFCHIFCIESVKKQQFSELNNLETLVLEFNRIKIIEDDTFSNLNKLSKLKLNDNNIEKLNPKSFAGLRNLKELYLSSNKLEEFDHEILCNMNKIEKIDLRENTIMNKDNILSVFKDSNIKFYFD